MGKKVDLTGQRFGKLVVLGECEYRDKTNRIFWNCRCDCGNSIKQRSDHLKKKIYANCGCVPKQGKIKNISGKRFGKLIVLNETSERSKSGAVIWQCLCDCGKFKRIIGGSLTQGLTKSCGCEKDKYFGNVKDIRGIKFGKLTPVRDTNKRSHKSVIWECLCDCGNKSMVTSRSLMCGDTTSCGCIKETVLFASGIDHPRYNPQLTSEDRLNRRYQLNGKNSIRWSRLIMESDDFTCQTCSQRGYKLNAHHINAWNAFPEQRFDTANGITLCEECHKEYHHFNGRGNNTFEEFRDHIACTVGEEYVSEIEEVLLSRESEIIGQEEVEQKETRELQTT